MKNLLTLAATFILLAVARAAEKPNIIFILSDDLAQADVGCYGQKPIEIYNLKTDAAESKNLAAEKSDLVAKAETLMKSAHTDDPNWPMRDGKPKAGKK